MGIDLINYSNEEVTLKAACPNCWRKLPMVAFCVAFLIIMPGCDRGGTQVESLHARAERLGPQIRDAAEAYAGELRRHNKSIPTAVTVEKLLTAGYLKGIDVAGLELVEVLLPADPNLPTEEFRLLASDIEQVFAGVSDGSPVPTPQEQGDVVYIKLTSGAAEALRKRTASSLGRMLRLLADDQPIMEARIVEEIEGPWLSIVCASNPEAKQLVSRIEALK
jgi:hypothetical protein